MSQTLKMIEINRLLTNTPSPAHADARARLQAFVEVTAPFDLRHIQRAVSMILSGGAEGVDPKYAIYPPVLSQLCRQIRDKELAQLATRRAAIAQIEDRSKVFHEDPPEVRRAAVAAGLARLEAGKEPPETLEQAMARKAEVERRLKDHDRLFLGSDTDESRRSRLWGNR